MKKLLSMVALVAALLTMSGCSAETVPQGTKGKILDRSGVSSRGIPTITS
jgi:hypothetical protein